MTPLGKDVAKPPNVRNWALGLDPTPMYLRVGALCVHSLGKVEIS